MTVIMLTSSAVIVCTSAAFIAYGLFNFQRNLLQNSETIAQITSANAGAALLFDDDKMSAEILGRLQAQRGILKAALYDKKGQLFARLPATAADGEFPAAPGRDGHNFDFNDKSLVIFFPVEEGGKRVGTLYLKSDLKPMYARMRFYGGIVACVIVAALLIALVLSNWLQKRISEPILELAETAKAVSIKRDFTVRAKKFGHDELGLLTDAFNDMLAQIHERAVALRGSEARKTAILESALDAIISMDEQGCIVDFNPAAERIFGYKRDDVAGKTVAEIIIPPHLRDAHWHGLKKFLATGEGPVLGKRIELPAMKSDGSLFTSELSISVARLDAGQKFFTAYLRDVTDRKKAEEARAFLAAIVESSDDAIIGKDLEGRIMSWNHGAEQMYGYTAAEAIGKPVQIIVPPHRLDEEAQVLRRLREGRIQHYETVRARKNHSELYVSLTISPIKNSAGQIIGASSSSRDISERIRAEEQIRILNIELEQRVAQRTAELNSTNQELEAFTYSVSHDLRAPLRHIDGFAQILEEENIASLSPDVKRYIGRIRLGVQNMGRLVDDLLNLSRVGRGEIKKEKIHPNEMVNEVLSEMKFETAKRNIEWQIGALPVIEGDPGLVRQVFANLISNAIKYTRPREKAVIQIDRETVNGEAAIFIRDNGVGFDMRYADKLFGVFQRLHREDQFEGTGVGLATVRRIIHLHHGRIWVEAEVDKGATFHFTMTGMQTT